MGRTSASSFRAAGSIRERSHHGTFLGLTFRLGCGVGVIRTRLSPFPKLKAFYVLMLNQLGVRCAFNERARLDRAKSP